MNDLDVIIKTTPIEKARIGIPSGKEYAIPVRVYVNIFRAGEKKYKMAPIGDLDLEPNRMYSDKSGNFKLGYIVHQYDGCTC